MGRSGTNKVLQRLVQSPLPIVAQDKVERSGRVVHLRVKSLQVFEAEQEGPDAAKLPTASRDFHLAPSDACQPRCYRGLD